MNLSLDTYEIAILKHVIPPHQYKKHEEEEAQILFSKDIVRSYEKNTKKKHKYFFLRSKS